MEWWAENPCLFFEINPEGIDYGFLFWSPKPAAMKAFRRKIADKPEAFVKMISAVEKDTGVSVTAEEYKRPETCPNKNLERFYLWKKSICLIQHEDFSPDTFGPELGDRVRDFLEKLIPIYDYFTRI